jgi:3-phenylpropionate/trans-cinnamate dioxygenase ferredoxin reductase component
MPSDQTFVVVGGGLAGGKAVTALREQGFDGSVVLVAEEVQAPYERPPLSKDYLAGKASRADFDVHPFDWYRENNVELRLGTRAVALHRDQSQVELSDGARVTYDRLLLATGAQPRRLRLTGSDADGVHYLRTVDDSDALRAALERAGRLAIIGAGWIGMEVAAVARQRDVEVAVLESAALPLLAALGPELASVFADLHREHGVDLRMSARIDAITTHEGSVTGVRLADGGTVPADAVLIAVGAAPMTELAEHAGLDVDNGVLVDAALRTSDPQIVAAGDVANTMHPVLGARIRVEHWANALKQPAVAAATMLGRDEQYTDLPYFYTDQYDLGMEYVGYAPPGSYAEIVTRGDVNNREFIAFWLDRAGRVKAGMNVNVWDVTDAVKSLILSGRPVNRTRLSDPDTALEDVLA